MHKIIDGIDRFRSDVFARQRDLYETLARDGQRPTALVISCSDSRVMPEIVTQRDPGDLFVIRNAGNIVPPHGGDNGGIGATIEYAVVGLGVEHIVVCGHTDCGAMKAVLDPGALAEMPTVARWLGHCRCGHGVFRRVHEGKVDGAEAARVIAMENVVAQLANLRTHPSVASRLAAGDLSLHGWIFDIARGDVLALDGATRSFVSIGASAALPVAVPAEPRAVSRRPRLMAAE